MTINQQHQQERNNKGSNDVEISNDEDVQIGIFKLFIICCCLLFFVITFLF